MARPPVLDYFPVLPEGRRFANLIRVGMVVLAIVAIHVAGVLLFNPVFAISESLGGGALGTPAAPLDASLSREAIQKQYIFRAVAYFAVFLLSQWVFLMPRGGWKIRLSTDGPPPRRAAIAAGLIGMLLSIGLLATLMELPNWWLMLTAEKTVPSTQHFAAVWVVMLLVWGGWSVVFYRYWRSRDRYTALTRVFRWLLAGTILELVIAAPAHAWIVHTRGDDCYCQRGTWTGVVFGCTAAFWLFGPGAFLLFLREKKRREELIGRWMDP